MASLVTLNVGGTKFTTTRETLAKHPDTTLSLEVLTADKFFFDRSGILFENILNYYRTGILEAPANVSKRVWDNEVAYWKLPNTSPIYSDITHNHRNIVDAWLSGVYNKYIGNVEIWYLCVPNIDTQQILNKMKKFNIVNRSLRDIYVKVKNFSQEIMATFCDRYCRQFNPSKDVVYNKKYTHDYFNTIVTKEMAQIIIEKLETFCIVNGLLKYSKIFRQEVKLFFEKKGYKCDWKRKKYRQNAYEMGNGLCEFDCDDLNIKAVVFCPGFDSEENFDIQWAFPSDSVCDKCIDGSYFHTELAPECVRDDMKDQTMRMLKFYPN